MTPHHTLHPETDAPDATSASHTTHLLYLELVPLPLLHHNGNYYVTLKSLAALMRYTAPASAERQLTYKLSDIKDTFPKGSIYTFTHPNKYEELALSLPHAIKLVSHFRSRDFLALHGILLDVLTKHIPNMQALEATEVAGE